MHQAAKSINEAPTAARTTALTTLDGEHLPPACVPKKTHFHLSPGSDPDLPCSKACIRTLQAL